MNNQQHYDKYKRNQEARAFYKSTAWEKCRDVVLRRDHYLCQECYRNKKVTPADLVHHIVELLNDWDMALDPDNLESLCHSCHNRKHPEKGFVKLERGIYTVLGYPASGKTTFVQSIFEPLDLVFDLDRFITAMTFKDGHDRTGNADKAVPIINDMLKDTVKNIRTKRYKFNRLFVIRTKLTDEEWFHLEMAGAKFLLVDTDREVCINRINLQERRIPSTVFDSCQEFYQRKLEALELV
ncbi:HNH endonuclease [Bacillus sp. T33-2]|uniref:HNH endonuclease n=1 Tax=Bacillus sp. T33-2 TaxID=2054168 RepID=UPI000C776D27|nr:HNH endonuclease [Bacillus sp. T33-2]PLR93200.1 hypothetical protein CVD19_19545 [Bacillus sp. T33-2]